MNGLGLKLDCGGADACEVPAGALPCENEIAGLFECALDNLALVCAPSGQDTPGDQPASAPLPQSAAACQAALTAFTSCAEANHLNDTTDNTDQNPPGGGDCNQGNACTKCVCKAGSDTTKLLACESDCANP